jgi:hypothetical protein
LNICDIFIYIILFYLSEEEGVPERFLPRFYLHGGQAVQEGCVSPPRGPWKPSQPCTSRSRWSPGSEISTHLILLKSTIGIRRATDNFYIPAKTC